MLFQRLGGGKSLWMPAIGLGKGSFVGLGGRRVLGLERSWSGMRLFCCNLLHLCGSVLNPSLAAVVRNMIGIGHNALLHNRRVDVRHVDDTHVHARHRGVVGKRSAPPLAARKPNAAESEAVVHAAVVSNCLAPVAVMESVLPVVPSPVRRCPQRAAIGSRHPRARYPVVISVVVGIRPIPWRPHQVRLRAHWLHIDGQHRRRKPDIDAYANAELSVRIRGNHRYQQSKQEKTRDAQ